MRISDWSSDVCSSDLCADHANLRDVQALGPASGRARSTLFMEWAGLEGPIPDPYTGGDEHFEQVWAQVDEAAQAAVARLRGDCRIIPVRRSDAGRGGKSVSVGVDLGGRRIIKTKTK